MSLLNAVRWPDLLADLLEDASDETREAAFQYAASRDVDPFVRRGLAFARLVLPVPAVALRPAITACSTLDMHQVDRVARWLVDTAPTVMRLALGSIREQRPTVPVQAGRLTIDEALPDLPLVPLAADLAARIGGLAVVAAELPPGIGGVHDGAEHIIRLDPRDDPAACFPHELGHALDPLLGQRGNPVLDEKFADLLGGLLLDYLPTSVAGAAEYLDLALAEVTSVQAEAAAGEALDLPAPGTESVLAFCALPLVAGLRGDRP